MPTERTLPPPAWTRQDARELRRLAKYLRKVNQVAGVYDPSGGVIEGDKRAQYLKLASRLAAAMGCDRAPWADEVAWGGHSKDLEA